MYQFPPALMEDQSLGSTKTKCSQESNSVQEHLYVKIEPLPDHTQDDMSSVDPMEVLRLTKRLMICTSCGNLRLTN